MTKPQLLKALREIENNCVDYEVNHRMADDLLLKYINDKKIREAFEKIEKHYA